MFCIWNGKTSSLKKEKCQPFHSDFQCVVFRASRYVAFPSVKKKKNNHMMTLSYFWGYAFCFPFYSFSFKCRGSSAQSVACFSNENLLIQHWPSLASNCVNFGQVYWKVFGQPYLTRENACDVFLFVELNCLRRGICIRRAPHVAWQLSLSLPFNRRSTAAKPCTYLRASECNSTNKAPPPSH